MGAKKPKPQEFWGFAGGGTSPFFSPAAPNPSPHTPWELPHLCSTEEVFPSAVHPWEAEVKPNSSRCPLFPFETVPAAPSLSGWPHWSWRKELESWRVLARAVPQFPSLWKREGEEKGTRGHLELAQRERDVAPILSLRPHPLSGC